MPLYADDRSKIYTAYARSALDLSVCSNLPRNMRLKLWDQYTNHFQMDVSIDRFHEIVGESPVVRPDLEHWISLSENIVYLSSISKKRQAFAQFRSLEDVDYTVFTEQAIFVPSNHALNEATTDTMREVETLKVLYSNPIQKRKLEAALDDSNSSRQQRTYHSLMDIYTGPYSDGQLRASQKADKIGEAMAQTLSEDSYFSKIFPQEINSEIALLISDLCYRMVQVFDATRLGVENIEDDQTVIFPKANIDFASIAADRGQRIVLDNLIYDASLAPSLADSIVATEKKHTELQEAEWDAQISALDKRLLNWAAKFDISTVDPNVFVLCNLRSHSYKDAVNSIKAQLDENYSISVLETGPPEGLVGNVVDAALQNLYSLLRSFKASQIRADAKTVEGLVNAAFESITGLDNFDKEGIRNRSYAIIKNNMGTLIAHARLYKILQGMTQSLPKTAQALVVPGRDPSARIMTKAFQSSGLKTTDVQVLFVSNMPRYKAPTADHLAVIDSYARDHFCEKYGYKTEDITMIGSINLEADIALARACDGRKTYSKYFRGKSAPVFTYAMQPLPIEDILQAVKWCAQTLEALPDIRLIIKLHPAQPDDIIDTCRDVIKDHVSAASASRYAVVHKRPFHEAIAISDVLLTHYSNVAMTAAALGKAVGTLPVTGTRPSPTLAEMNMTENINSSQELVTFVGEKLNSTKQTKTQYLSENPHIEAGGSLVVLEKLIAKNVAAARSDA